MKKEEREWRREERDKIEKELNNELDGLRWTIESVKEDGRKLKLEIEDLRKKFEEERFVKDMVGMTNGLIEEKVNSASQESNTEMSDKIRDISLAQPSLAQPQPQHSLSPSHDQ